MSNIINPTGYEDPVIDFIRNQVKSKSDDIPYLLLPVKIETRFMKVDRVIYDPDTFPDVLEGLFEMDERLRYNPKVLPSHEVLGKIRKLQNLFDDINSNAGKIKRLSGNDKEYLQTQLVQIEKSHRILSRNLSQIHWNDEEKMRELRNLKNETAKKVQLTTTIISELKPTGETAFTETVSFLDTLEEMSDALHNMGRKKISTNDRKEKRRIFNYLDTQISKTTQALRVAKNDMGINMHAATSQLKKLNELKDELDGLFDKARKNINTIKSNYKRAEYNEKLTQITEQANALYDGVDKRVKPKLEMKQSLKTINAREVLWQVNVIRARLKQLNRSPFRTYDEVRNTRQKLYKKLHTLRAGAHKIVEGNEEELKAISKSWDDTDKELEKFITRVKAFKGVGTQKAGLTRTITHINKEYRSDLSGLKSTSKSYFTTLSNITLEKSAVNYTTSLNKLKALNTEIENVIKKPSAKKVTEVMTKVVDLQSSLSVLSRDIHILPQKAFNELNKLSVKIESDIRKLASLEERIADRSKKAISLSQRAIEAATSIKSTVDAQYSDASDRKDRFYDKVRSPFVFARKTITRDELWVRIYPDDIAIHTHEEALTAEEVEAGKAYWLEIWAANDDYDGKLAAWRAISTAYGSQRAAWIIKTMEPKPEDSSVISDRLRLYSKDTIQLIENLQKVSGMLKTEGASGDLIMILGKAYPILNQIEEEIKKIGDDLPGLLLKTQKLLLKVQSQINAIVRSLQKLPETDRAAIEGRLEVVSQFVNAFNRIINSFKGIKRITSKEIIRKENAFGVFPEVEIKDGSWTIAPHSKVMPDRFAVLTIARNGHYKHIVAGKPLPTDKLIVGLDPATFETESFQYDEDGNLIVDENIEWLTDFNEAINKGMAVTITLDEEDLAHGFEKVFVLGVKDSTADDGQELLEKLLENHHYIHEGASFLPVTTPTNNTEAGESGYRTFEEDAALSFAIERNNEEPVSSVSNPDFPSDGERLAEGLGIDPDILNNLDYHDRTEVSEALTLNKALFPGTLGNYMEEGMDTLFTLDNINHTKEFFNEYVTSRGFLPSIRVGTQPYGILATTAFSEFNATSDDSFIPTLNKEDFENPASIKDELQTRFDIRLKQLLNKINTFWTDIRNEKVPHAGNTNPDDPQAHFMEMLGLQANSTEIFYRYGLNIASRQTLEADADFSINFDPDDPWGPTKVAESFRNSVLSGYYFNSDDFHDEQEEYSSWIDHLIQKNNRISNQFSKLRLFTTRHLADQSQILGDIIDSRDLSEKIVAATNPNTGTAEEKLKARAELQYFIDWLVDQNPWDIHAENKYSEVADDALTAGVPSKSLLFLVLRHSMLSAYADAILKILEYEGLIDQETRKKMGQPAYFYSRFSNGFNYVTKWTYLFSKIDQLNHVLGFEMDTSNAFYNYMNSMSGSSNGFLNRYLSPEHPFVFNNYTFHNQHQAFIEELTETREAILKLKDIPTTRLDQLMVEHLDLCTYRLDAWRLGMANKRLKKQRETNDTGIYIGAYGWVEDLKKGGDREIAGNLPEGLWKNGDDPVYTDEDNLGFIHTPSLNHAITAAILRAGFDANSDTAEINNQMAVNLSSERVRMALNLLNGIRNGQDAAALLGYQFERGLHERYLHVPLELDEYIYDFRTEFPLSVPVDDSVSLGEATLNNVVNGLELLETAQDFVESQGGPPNPGDSLYQSLKAFETAWWNHVGNTNISSASVAKRRAMLTEIDRMADAFDALGDLCISESVYQVARGNHVRASSIMDKLAKGDMPNEIEIADTPRTGTVVTHKVGLFFEVIIGIDHELTASGEDSTPVAGTELDAAVISAGARPTGWNSVFTPRAIAEPTLNKWVGHMIGDPSKIKCHVTYTIGEIVDTMTVTLANLEIQPLDAVHLLGTGPLDGGAELNARIAMKVKSSILIPAGFEGTTDDAEINIKYTVRDESWLADDYSFYEKAGYIQSIRKLLTDSAFLAADSLLIPGEEEVEDNEVRNEDVDEYLIRTTNLQARLELLQEDWTTFFTDEISAEDAEGHTFTEAQVDMMCDLLIRSSIYGIGGTLPERLSSYGDEVGLSLIAASDGASKAIANRLKQAEKDIETAKDDTKSNNVRVRALQEAGKNLLGKAFVMLPHFILRNGADISAQITLAQNKGLLRASPPQIMENWSNGLARVRERIAGLDTLQMWAENFEKSIPDKQPVQFPFALNEDGTSVDHWLGVEFPDGYQPEEDKLSLVLINTGEITASPDASKAALLIDEWVEIIPNINETTAVAFNYDQPDAKPPNTLLLAVTPKETGAWQWDNLVYTLNDTLEMAKNRAVEPEHLEDTVFGQILPAIMTEIVPPQLLPGDADDSGDAQDNPLGLQVVTDFRVVNETYKPETEE